MVIELARVPGKGEDAPEETWGKIRVWSAKSAAEKGRSRFAAKLAKLDANETVVIIARDADEYRDVEYLKYDERVHIKVVYGDTPEAQEAVDNLGLEPYQIIKDRTAEQLGDLFTELIIYSENGIDLESLYYEIEIQREIAEDIAKGV